MQKSPIEKSAYYCRKSYFSHLVLWGIVLAHLKTNRLGKSSILILLPLTFLNFVIPFTNCLTTGCMPM